MNIWSKRDSRIIVVQTLWFKSPRLVVGMVKSRVVELNPSIQGLNKYLIPRFNHYPPSEDQNTHVLPKINKIILSGGINSKINTVSSKVVATIIHMVARSKPVLIRQGSIYQALKENNIK